MIRPVLEKIVQPGIRNGLLVACPKSGLVAAGTLDDRIRIYRLNGEEIITIRQATDSRTLVALQWKADGTCLIAGYDDGVSSLINATSGQDLHRLESSAYTTARLTDVSWSRYQPHALLSDPAEDGDAFLDFAKQCNINDARSEYPPLKDLTRLGQHLGALDAECALPKLSPLSSGGLGDDAYGSRASLDSIFPSEDQKPSAGSDVLLVCSEDGSIQLSIYDLFEIGVFRLSDIRREWIGFKVWRVCHHVKSATCGLIICNEENQKPAWVPLNLKLLSQSGTYLSTFAARSTQIVHLVRYLRRVHIQIMADYKACFDLPRRFIANINETLKSAPIENWSNAIYHLLATGTCDEHMHEWLTTIIGERGHKRWDKSVTAGYEGIRRLVHQNLLPALQRCTVLASRLHGLSRYPPSAENLGLAEADVTKLIQCLSKLQFVAHKMIIHANLELRHFQAFSYWLHCEIMNHTAPSSTDHTEAASKLDLDGILAHVESHTKPGFLDQSLDPARSSEAALPDHSIPNTKLASGIDTAESQELETNDLNRLIDKLHQCVGTVLEGVSITQRRHVQFGSSVSLGITSVDMVDARIITEIINGEVAHSHWTASLIACQKNQVQINCFETQKENDVGQAKQARRVVLDLGDYIIKHMIFATDDILLVNVESQSISHLLAIPFQRYMAATIGIAPLGIVSHVDVQPSLTGIEIGKYTWIQFEASCPFKPARMTVSESIDQPFVCVSSADGLRFRIHSIQDLREFLDTADEDMHCD